MGATYLSLSQANSPAPARIASALTIDRQEHPERTCRSCLPRAFARARWALGAGRGMRV